jgi:ubiquinone/menaquinone biosynthesis C-methylase UbiE
MLNVDKLKHAVARRMIAPDAFNALNSTINLQFITSVASESLKLLDCGCGLGENIMDIERKLSNSKLMHLYGIDIHYPTILKCRSYVSAKVNILLANCLHIPIADNCIDIVLSNQVIEHIKDYNGYLSEIARVLKPGGFLIISTPNFHCPRNTLLKLIGHKPILRWANIKNLPPEEFRGHVQEFTEEELKTLLYNYRFLIVQNRPILPKLCLGGNWLFNVYSILEYLFFLCSKPFVATGYSKNTNLLCQLSK